jgi:hypothetical protein
VQVVRFGQGEERQSPGSSETWEQGDALEEEYELVLVTWRDAWFDFDQPGVEDGRDDYLVHTVGFLVSDGPRFLSIAQEILPDGDGFRAVTHIPLSIIETTVPLRPEPAAVDDLAPG